MSLETPSRRKRIVRFIYIDPKTDNGNRRKVNAMPPTRVEEEYLTRN